MVKAEVRIIDPYRPDLNKTYICYPTETHIINEGTTTYEFHFEFQFPAIPRMTNKEAINCISREAVIQIIENKLNPCTDMFKCLEMSEIKEDVEHLPPVTPQTVTEFADKCEECGKIKEDLYEKGFEAGKRYIVEQMCALLEKEGKDEKTE